MADIAGLIAGLAICPDVVTPAADTQMPERVMANLAGTPSAERRAGNDSLQMAFGQMGPQGFLGDLITLTEDDIMNLQARLTHAVANPLPIPVMQKRKAVIVVATHQHCARLKVAKSTCASFRSNCLVIFAFLSAARMRKSSRGKQSYPVK